MVYIKYCNENTFVIIGDAASINGLCMTPSKFQAGLGEFREFCPVNLALHEKLIDCSTIRHLKYAAEYRYLHN